MEKNTLQIKRQGDCGLHLYDASLHGEIIKESPLVIDEDGFTLLKGEATHHHHIIRDPENVKAWKGKVSGLPGLEVNIIEVEEDSALEHFHVKEKREADHRPIPLEKRTYIQDIQVEHWPEGYQRVSD